VPDREVHAAQGGQAVEADGKVAYFDQRRHHAAQLRAEKSIAKDCPAFQAGRGAWR
jgi:hypothetical protein